MKTSLLLTACLSLLPLTQASAASCACGAPSDAPAKVAAATDPATYPLDTCVVSGEKLGSMGAPFDYLHKEEGKPDRLVRFCCKMCVGSFKKNPAKYLKLLDEPAVQNKA